MATMADYQGATSNRLTVIRSMFKDMAEKPKDDKGEYDYQLMKFGEVILDESVRESQFGSISTDVVLAAEAALLQSYLPVEMEGRAGPMNFIQTRRALLQSFLKGWSTCRDSEADKILSEHLLSWPYPSRVWKDSFETDVRGAMKKSDTLRIAYLFELADGSSNGIVIKKAAQTLVGNMPSTEMIIRLVKQGFKKKYS